MTAIDIEAIETLDFDYEIPCEVNTFNTTLSHCGGNSPAEWKATGIRKCCNTSITKFFCGPCLQIRLKYSKEQGNRFYCGNCYTFRVPWAFTHFERIKS